MLRLRLESAFGVRRVDTVRQRGAQGAAGKQFDAIARKAAQVEFAELPGRSGVDVADLDGQRVGRADVEYLAENLVGAGFAGADVVADEQYRDIVAVRGAAAEIAAAGDRQGALYVTAAVNDRAGIDKRSAGRIAEEEFEIVVGAGFEGVSDDRQRHGVRRRSGQGACRQHEALSAAAETADFSNDVVMPQLASPVTGRAHSRNMHG